MGYLGHPESTRRLFDGDWLETGDLGYLAGGDLNVTGRSKDLIIRAGRHIHPKQIAENSAVDAGVLVARTAAGTGTEGFDAARNCSVDLIEAGIVDPTKVVRIALENAVSVASVVLLTEATMTEIPEPRKEASTAPEMDL